MLRYSLIVSLSIATVGSVATLTQGRASDEPFVRLTFRLDEENLVIFLPKGARHTAAGTRGNRVVFSLTKRHRLQRSLHLTTASEVEVEFTHRLQMTSGSLLEFQVKDDTGDSAGSTAELTGRMKVGRHVLSVLCTDRDRENLEPDWCLPYLNSLEIVKRAP